MVLRLVRLAALIGAFSAASAAACVVPTGSDARLNQDRIDQQLLSQAILAEVNYRRCQARLDALKPATATLVQVAKGHSAWMAASGRMSHRGGRETGRTLSDRVRRAGLRPQIYAENLAFLPRYRFGENRFRVDSRADCRFVASDGRVIDQHSYRSLARTVVSMWMKSPGHRRNMLSTRQRHMSAGASLSPDDLCGRYYITQIFVG